MEQDTERLRVCKRCLIRDMADQEEYYRSLQDYVENLDIDIKTPDTMYEERLALCRKCEMLMQGMCRKCGCYVELRAALRKNACPAKQW